jgi:hypothetical protein
LVRGRSGQGEGQSYQETELANPLFVRTGIVAGIGTVAVLTFFAGATGVLPLRALMSHAATLAATPQETASTEQLDAVAMVAPAMLPTKAVEKVALVAPVPDKPALTLTNNDVVSGSFAALPAQLQKPATAEQPRTVAMDAAVTAPLTKRSVRVMAVKPDGTPDFSAPQSDDQTVAQAYAEPHRPPVWRDIPALDAAAQIGAGQKPAVVVDKPAQVASIDPAPVAVTKSAGKTGVILGSGANVRSAPSKGNNKVLFALAGGTSVKLGDSKNGWWRVTDNRGRTGWVYKDYLKR